MQLFPFGLKNFEGQEGVFASEQDRINLLGGKGAGLHWMIEQGLSVPPGFVIPTSAWTAYKKSPVGTMKQIAKDIKPYLKALEEHFGYMPLVAVRSGARVSCPGMMDTIPNVGLDEKNYSFWVDKLGASCCNDCRHRLVTMYGSVVRGLDYDELEISSDFYFKTLGEEFPGAEKQILGSIEAVFKSWENERAKIYRKMHGYKDEWGTAVTVQAMVFGNLNEQSGTGVLFTRNPNTGENEVTGEFLINAQGEDVVAGIRTPMPLSKMVDWNPEVSSKLLYTVSKLEEMKKDMQDVEFTIQDGELYLLQTRNAKRTPIASLKIAMDMLSEKLIDPPTALKRVSPREFDLAQQDILDPEWNGIPKLTGISACSGIVSGVPVFSSADAIKCKEPCILITDETTPDDISGMIAAKGVITMKGGATSHAAVVARGMNKPCIVGVGAKVRDFEHQDVISMDGSTGNIWADKVPVIKGDHNPNLGKFMQVLKNHAPMDIPIIYDPKGTKMEKAVLYLGEKLYNPELALGVAISAVEQVDHLYIDLSPAALPSEKLFAELFSEAKAEHQLVYALHAWLKTHTLPGKVVHIIGDVELPEGSSLKLIPVTTDLKSLILAKDLVVMAGLDAADEATAKVMQWKMAEGVKGFSLGAIVEGSVSALSAAQALQYMCK